MPTWWIAVAATCIVVEVVLLVRVCVIVRRFERDDWLDVPTERGPRSTPN